MTDFHTVVCQIRDQSISNRSVIRCGCDFSPWLRLRVRVSRYKKKKRRRKRKRKRKEKEKNETNRVWCVCTRVSVRLCVSTCTVIEGAGIEAGNAEEYARDCKLRGYRSFRGGTSPNRSRSSELGFEKHLTVPDAGFLTSGETLRLEGTRSKPG